MISAANLIPAPRRHARAARVRSRLWGAVCTVVALGLVCAYASLSSMESENRQRLEAALESVGRKVDMLERDLGQAKARNGELSRKLAITKAMVDHPDWSVLLGLISETRGRQVMLERVSLRPTDVAREAQSKGAPMESYTLRIGGLAAAQLDVMSYVAALEHTKLFDAVRPPETRSRTVGGRELVGFDIECVVSARVLENPAREGGAP